MDYLLNKAVKGLLVVPFIKYNHCARNCLEPRLINESCNTHASFSFKIDGVVKSPIYCVAVIFQTLNILHL